MKSGGWRFRALFSLLLLIPTVIASPVTGRSGTTSPKTTGATTHAHQSTTVETTGHNASNSQPAACIQDNGNNTSLGDLNKRVLDVQLCDVDPVESQTHVSWLDGMIWGNVDQAERIYSGHWHKQGLQQKAMTSIEMRRYWTREASSETAKAIFTHHRFQAFYRGICTNPLRSGTNPSHGGAVGPHAFFTYTNDHNAATLPEQEKKPITDAKFNFVMNVPDGIMILLSSREPLAIARSKNLQATKEQLMADMPIPWRLSDVALAEWTTQHKRQARDALWHNFGMGYKEVQEKMGHLDYVVVADVEGPHESLLDVVHCLRTKNIPPGQIPAPLGAKFEAGEQCFAVLLGLPANAWIGWMLATHKDKKVLGHKMLASVQVFSIDKSTDNDQAVTFVWHVVDWTQQLENEARQRELADASSPSHGGAGPSNTGAMDVDPPSHG